VKPVPGAATSVQVTPAKQGLPAQPLMSVQVAPSPVVPAGQAPHVRPRLGGGRSVHVTPVKHGMLVHALVSVQVTPLPV